MPYYFVKTSHMGSTGDLFKAATAEAAALRAAKRWPRAHRLFVWCVMEDSPLVFEPETQVEVTGVRRGS